MTEQINGNGTKVEYVYNSRGLLTNLLNKKSDNTVLSSFAYTLDAAGNRVGMTEADGATTTWSYDDLYQLTREVKRNGAGTVFHDVSYTYDLAQNRTSMTNNLTNTTTNYTYNDLNQMLTAGDVSFTYDANGNTLSRTVGGQTTSYTWDYENKLTQMTYPNGTTNTFTTNTDGVRGRVTTSSAG
ncbi:MAG: RHS repeat protein [Abditibacteriales bacterium]|nr:RHS repeat protein [Abditibacteriales bacterium]